MTTTKHWSDGPHVAAPRHGPQIVSPGTAAALLLAADPGLAPVPGVAATSPADVLRGLPGPDRDWNVELAVLARLDDSREVALALLLAALEFDLDLAQQRRGKPALRLYDLYAAAADADGRVALAALVRARSSDPALLARAALWEDASRRAHPRLWHVDGPGGRSLAIELEGR